MHFSQHSLSNKDKKMGMVQADEAVGGGFSGLIERAAVALKRPTSEILHMLANGCDSASNNRRAMASMERFEETTRLSWATPYRGHQARYDAEAQAYETLAALVRSIIVEPPPELPAQPSLFDKPRRIAPGTAGIPARLGRKFQRLDESV
jgi:hypothetical protein